MKLSELKNKEIIDIDSGVRLGKLADCEVSFDEGSGRLIDLMIPDREDCFHLFAKSDVRLISWERIQKISDEFILIGSHDDTLG